MCRAIRFARSKWLALSVEMALFFCSVSVGVGAATLTGTVVGPDGPLVGAEVKLTSYADKACLDLANKKQASPEEKKRLQECKHESLLSVKTAEGGRYEFHDLLPAWYSLLITWSFSGTVPKCPSPFMGEYFAVHFTAKDGRQVIVATGQPFEAKTDDKVQKDFRWCLP